MNTKSKAQLDATKTVKVPLGFYSIQGTLM